MAIITQNISRHSIIQYVIFFILFFRINGQQDFQFEANADEDTIQVCQLKKRYT